MPFLGRWEVDDLLTFPANTHSPSTGAATDADSVPSYRVYEDETGTPILTGSMALLDSANTAGFYSEQITLSAANGFEVGKCYTVYVSATVGGITSTMAHTFQVEAALATASALATVQADTDDIQARLPAALVSGRIDSSVGAIAANAITATAINADAITAAKIADGAIDAATFAAGAINAAAIATDAITAAKIAADAIGASELAADAVTEIQSGLATAAAIAALNNLSAAQVNAEADTALADAGITTTVTGRIDAAISTRLATAGYTAPDNADILLIKAKTDNLPSDPADASDVAASFSSLASTLATIADYIDTEVASILAAVDTEVGAIKAKTDNLPAAPSATSDIPSANAIADAVLTRSASNTESSAGIYSLTALILAAFESAISGATWTINRTDGVTPFATRAVTTDAAADPVVGVQ